MKNSEIAASFKLLADLMELHGENQFRTRAYRSAYNSLRKFAQPLGEMTREEIDAIQGIGKSAADKIDEALATGRIGKLEQYKEKTPGGVQQLLGIRGLGPSKIKALWEGLGIESPGELLYACNENRLVELKGFGEKTQRDIAGKLEFFLESRDKKLFAAIEDNVEEIEKSLAAALPGNQIARVGEVRRNCPIVHEIGFLINKELEKIDLEGISGLDVLNEGAPWDLELGGCRFTLHTSSAANFGSELFTLTGPDAFVSSFQEKSAARNEKEVFTTNGKTYFEPELRDLPGEVLKRIELNGGLVNEGSLKGIVHNHSTYSDGLHTLREMSEYVKESGYEYFGISDHSQTAVYAGGLTPEELVAQMAEVDALNQELAPFRVFKGIESDILPDGNLDYEDDLLEKLDFVVASVHSGLKMDEAKATERLIKAIEHPATTILGHATGRLLLAREGYPIDHRKVIDACRANGVAIEMNANPLRLDMDYRWIPYAMEQGVWISINPDAHSREGIHNVRYGVLAARKGGLPESMCLNALSLEAFENWLSTRRG